MVDRFPDKPMVKSATENIIQWTVGRNGGGYISNYTVTLNADANFTEKNISKTLSVPNHHSLTQHDGMWRPGNLTSGVRYYVVVTAENCFGSNSSRVKSFCTHCGELQTC